MRSKVKCMINKIKKHLGPYYRTIKRNIRRQDYFKNEHVELPEHITLAFTLKCRAACPHCYFIQKEHAFNQKELVSEELLNKIFVSKFSSSIVSMSCGGGEALLHPNFFELLNLLPIHKLKGIQVVTNGLSLQDEYIVKKILEQNILTNIHISLDAADEFNYVRKKGIKECKFDLICQNIKKIATILKGKTTVGLSFVVYADDLANIKEMISLATELNVDYCHVTTLHLANLDNKLSTNTVKEMPFAYQEIMRNTGYGIDIIIQPPLHDKYMQYYCESLDKHLSLSPSGILSTCCHLPWNKEIGKFDEFDYNPVNNRYALEMRRKFILAKKENNKMLLPEECLYCNRRLTGSYYYKKDNKKWFFY
ncbi:Coenzyme PQQ synthesis protein E [uncultured archaeon]|nr:Coenzyme PQQ synthesis protein E [uncultured archaeon]